MTRNGIFIDCGAHVGEAYEHFSKVYPDHDYVMYEPNPHCHKVLVERYGNTNGNIPMLTIHNCAVFTHNGPMQLYANPGLFSTEVSESDGFSDGCSLLKEHNSLHYTASEVCTVQCVDISDVISKVVASGYSDVILRLDVEGSEYDILEKLYTTNQIALIKKLIVEFHAQYSSCPRMKAREQAIIARLNMSPFIEVEVWH
jgi:FkbM family methyltransferase